MSKVEDGRRISEAVRGAAAEAEQIAKIARAVAEHARIIADQDYVSNAGQLGALREVLYSLRNMVRRSENEGRRLK